MLATRSKLTIARRQSRSPRAVERRNETLAPPTRTTTSELMIDSRGIITACSDTLLQAIGVTKAQIVGNNVRALIPALPFQADTEGYNIAYATFSAAQKEARPWVIHMHDGRCIEAKGCITLQRTPTTYSIRLTIVSSMPGTCMLEHENHMHPPRATRITHDALLPVGASSQWHHRPGHHQPSGSMPRSHDRA